VANVSDLLDIGGFNLNAILEIKPSSLTDVDSEHDDDVTSFVWRESTHLDLVHLDYFLRSMVPK
jgi:hypothetical protein